MDVPDRWTQDQSQLRHPAIDERQKYWSKLGILLSASFDKVKQNPYMDHHFMAAGS